MTIPSMDSSTSLGAASSEGAAQPPMRRGRKRRAGRLQFQLPRLPRLPLPLETASCHPSVTAGVVEELEHRRHEGDHDEPSHHHCVDGLFALELLGVDEGGLDIGIILLLDFL